MPRRSVAPTPDKRPRPFANASRALGRRVRLLRAKRAWSQRETAARIGVGVAHVRRIEAGLGNPSLALLLSIARAFGISIVALLRG